MTRKPVLAGTLLALAAAVTASATASGPRPAHGRAHTRHFHAAASAGTQDPRGRARGDGAFIDLGPLGMTAACGANPHRADYCGPRNGAPIDAWGR